MGNFLTVHKIKAFIGTSVTSATPPAWTYSQINGLDNVAEAFNEVIQQYQFLENCGYATNHVTGAAPAWTLSGKRLVGDTAQDYIVSKKYLFDDDRKSNFKLEYVVGGTVYTLIVPCTFCNIQDIGGTSTDDSAFSVEIRFDGVPALTSIPSAG